MIFLKGLICHDFGIQACLYNLAPKVNPNQSTKTELAAIVTKIFESDQSAASSQESNKKLG